MRIRVLAGTTLSGVLALSSAGYAANIDGRVGPGDSYGAPLTIDMNLADMDGDVVSGIIEDAATLWREYNSDGKLAAFAVQFTRDFVDNTYGANASSGWGMDGHEFDKLLGSDHSIFRVYGTNAAGEDVSIDVKLDYLAKINTDPTATDTGMGAEFDAYGSAGVLDKGEDTALGLIVDKPDGEKDDEGDPLHMKFPNVATSLEYNLATYGTTPALLASLTTDSPVDADEDGVADGGLFPEWNYALLYEVELDLTAFMAMDFWPTSAQSVGGHASPSKLAERTLVPPDPSSPPPLTVVPVPAAAWMGLMMLGGLGGIRLVKRRRLS